MIIKLIDRKEGMKGANRYARNLALYMANANPRQLRPDAVGLDYGLTLSAYMTRQPERKEVPRERVLCRAALVGGAAIGWDVGVAEMERRMNARSSRVKKPARHVVLSYRDGEQPSEQQFQDAVALLVEELECRSAAVLWAAHADTNNIHVHALFVMIDPDTGAALPFGQGPGGRANHKEAMQRAIARIEHAQSLQAEAGGRYEVRVGHVVRKTERPRRPNARTPLRQEILAFENESGFASFTRRAQDIAGPILDKARSWTDLHSDLAKHGMGIRPAGNGGELHAGDEHVKLSNVDRRHSWLQLIKPDRLGPFVEPETVELAPYESQILDEVKCAAWIGRREVEQAIAARIDGRVAMLFAARDAALAEAKAHISAHSSDLATFDGDARLDRDIGNAWPRLRAGAAAAITAAFEGRIAAVRALRHAAAGSDDLELINLDDIGAFERGIVAPWYANHRLPPPIIAIEGYEAERSGDVVRYWATDLGYNKPPAMVDAGAIIWVNDSSDRTIAAALLLAKERYGGVAVFGDKDYLAGCKIAAEQFGIELEFITVMEARRRTRTWTEASTRQQSRRQAIENARRDRESDRLRRWARAYVRATPRESEPENPPVQAHLLRDLPAHDAMPSVQSLGDGVPIEPVPTTLREGVRSPAKYSRSQGSDIG